MTKRKSDITTLPLLSEYDQAAETARYYNFAAIETPRLTKDVLQKIRLLKDEDIPCKSGSVSEDMLLSSHLEGRAIMLELFSGDWQKLSKPISVFYELPIKKPGGKKRLPRIGQYALDIIGSEQSISDAAIIQTVKSILEDEGYKGLTFAINCVGEREVVSRFEKELTAYFRKNIHLLTPDQQQLFKDSVFSLLQCAKETAEYIALREEAPKAMSFLSEEERNYFKEVLEYLERLNIPYEIDGFLMENRHYSTHISFQVRDEKGTLLGTGSRYSGLARKLGSRKEIPAIGATLYYRLLKPRAKIKEKSFPTRQFYFMQLGLEAKLKCLSVIEMLRKKRIPLTYMLTRDKASSQLGLADTLKLPYVLIMGQKEAHENTIAVRDNSTRSQKTIFFDEIPSHLLSIKKIFAKQKSKNA